MREDCTGEAEELALTLGEIVAAFGDGGGEGGEDVGVGFVGRGGDSMQVGC